MKKYNNNLVDIYRRILKYTPFATRRRQGHMQILHKLSNGGEIAITASEYCTVEDEEKLYAVLYLVQHKRARVVVENNTVTTLCSISDVKKLTNCHDETHIENSLKRIRSLTIKYKFPGKTVITGLIHEAKLDYKTGILLIVWNKQFFNACSTHSFSLNLQLFCQLSATAKNVYKYIISNSSEIFTEKLLIERALIQASRYDKAQAMLKQALQELKDTHIIRDYELIKQNNRRFYKIKRYREEQKKLSTEGGGKLSIELGKTDPKISCNPAPVLDLQGN